VKLEASEARRGELVKLEYK